MSGLGLPDMQHVPAGDMVDEASAPEGAPPAELPASQAGLVNRRSTMETLTAVVAADEGAVVTELAVTYFKPADQARAAQIMLVLRDMVMAYASVVGQVAGLADLGARAASTGRAAPEAPVSFADLRAANMARLPEFRNSHGQLSHTEPDGSDWSPSQWLQAVVGELGEYANKRKKFDRGDIDYADFMAEAAKELADVQIYLDLLAFRLGIDLGAAVRDKFNEVSVRVGSSVRLGGPCGWFRSEGSAS